MSDLVPTEEIELKVGATEDGFLRLRAAFSDYEFHLVGLAART